MGERFTIALAQMKPHLGDVEANLALCESTLAEARERGVDLLVFPELNLTGYHLKDQVPAVAEPLDGPSVTRLREQSADLSVVLGFVEETPDHRFYNSAVYLERGKIVHVHRKVYLPTYGMFDEDRYFASGQRLRAFGTRFGRMATLVCEDLWHPSTAYIAALDGAAVLLCPSSSPARGIGGAGAQDENARTWELLNRAYAMLYGTFVVYVNRVGFEDGVGFWGGSEVIGPSGEEIAKAPYYETALAIAELDLGAVRRRRIGTPLLRDENVDLILRELERIRRESP